MKNSTIFSIAKLKRSVLVTLAASLLMSFAGVASAESWDTFKSNYEYKDAIHYLNKGYAELGKVVNKLSEDKNKSAVRHFNWAMKDFDKAVVYFAKVDLPANEKAAIDALKKGLNALESSTKAMEKGDIAKSQTDYDTAQSYFWQASYLTD